MPYDVAAFVLLLTAFFTGRFTVSMRCMANVATAASCFGSRCRSPISPQSWLRRAFRWRSTSFRLCGHPCHAVRYLLVEHRVCAGERLQRRGTLGTVAAVEDVDLAAVRYRGKRAMVCAHLWLAAAGFQFRAARCLSIAVLPPFAIGVVEKIAFNTHYLPT